MHLSVPPSSLSQFLSKARVLWSQWNVQTRVLTSFAIQLILILVVPFRKQTSNGVIIASIWLAYLLADWVAAQAIGLISRPCGSTTATSNDEVYAFWAQFLLLHLGGPDTITALALEDNELWLRTGLHLGVQVYGSLGVLVKSVAESQSKLWVPTLLIFVAGIIKYLERVSSLFHGRLLKFSNQELNTSAWEKIFEYRPFALIDESNNKGLTDVEMVKYAFYLFHYFKGVLFASQDLISAEDMYKESCLSERTPEEAFRVLEIQLNAAYEAFYTKTVVICTTLSWKVLRLVVTLLQVGSLVIWLFFTDKQGFRGYNIRITSILLVGAIAVEVFAFLRTQLWSDWTIAQVDDMHSRIRIWFYNKLLSTRKRTWGIYSRKEDAPIWTCFRRAFFRRWSESIPQLSLIDPCMDEQRTANMQKVIEFLGVREILDRHKYVNYKWFSNHLRDFIFEDLIEKRTKEGGVENIGNVKGGWACMSLVATYQTEMITLTNVSRILGIDGSYDVILLRWHIITELCYNDEIISAKTGKNNWEDLVQPKATNSEKHKHREICKTLSDYMMYLLVGF